MDTDLTLQKPQNPPRSHPPADDTPDIYASTAKLLGGLGIPPDSIRSPLDVHITLLQGLPGPALETLLSRLRILPRSGKRLESAMGVSLRSMQRKKGDATKRLTTEQAGRIWQFAEFLARATKIFGTQDAAERWLDRPAIGLDQKSPIDLLATPTGAQMVNDYLTRIEYGVYT